MIGSTLSNRYKIVNVLGAGGMGRTYVAEDILRPGNPKCVVKQLRPASTDPAVLTIARRLFGTEAEILERLGNHDQIPRLLAYFEQDQEFFLVQEFIDGHPLSVELPMGQRWSEPQVVLLMQEILGVLAFIHSQNVIHRDIKPDNIIRRGHDNKIVLIDFGAVKQVRMQQPTLVGQASVTVAIGTPGYMPTEQSSGKPRPSSDIYAVGMVGIQALTGRMPTELPEDEDGEVVWQDQATVGDSFAAILNKMVRHYFKHRYQTAAEVLQALHHLNTPTLAPPGISPGYLPPTQVSTGSYPGSVPYTPTPLPTNPIIPSQASPPAYPTPLPAPQTPAPIPYTPTPLPGTPAPLPHLSPPIPATGITPPRQEAGLTPSSPPSIPNIPQTQSVAPVMPTEAIPSIPPTQTAPDGFPYGQPSPTLPSQPNYGQPVYGSPGEYGQPGYSPIPQPQNLAGPQTTPLPGQNRSPQSNPLAVSKDPGASKRLLLIGGAIAFYWRVVDWCMHSSLHKILNLNRRPRSRLLQAQIRNPI
ncbi:MAG: protein kinase [Cyanobacteria bacterium CRU_2_1]|nr:protein kinase [Cyanobacteria bacterium CRU_2_1]